MKEYYENKVAVVTGAASGIGLALSEMILSLGARAIVMADINAGRLNTESERLSAIYPNRVLGFKTDVTSHEEIDHLIRRAVEFGSGRVDLLFNNAGLGMMKSFDDSTNEDWKLAFGVNFYSALYGIRAVLPVMRAQGGGHIANTASGIAFCPMANQSVYSATKAALVGLTLSLRYELWDENIRLSVVIPGTVATPIWQGNAPEFAITPEESARAILNGVALNERIVFVTDADRSGATYSFNPEAAKHMDEYLLNVARRRRGGDVNAL
jgi:NAD(P)-dependent dehydrogenase (short-subunit alcohol dehydrogenase family)